MKGPDHTERVVGRLVAAGWLKATSLEKHYRFVEHDKWAAEHPGVCYNRELLPWQEHVDTLVGKMHAMARGGLWLRDTAVVTLQASGSDDEILARWQEILNEAEANKRAKRFSGTGLKACCSRLVNEFKQRAANRSQS